MTVSVTAPRNDYLGTGLLDTYVYTFRIFSASDLRVTQRDAANVETVLALTTDYTVTGVNRPTGGTITLVAGALANGYTLTIRFNRVPQQSTDLRNQGGFFAETHENKFDELTLYVQSLRDVALRSLHISETEIGTDAATELPVAAERASKFLGFDSDGNVIVAPGTSADLGPVSSFINTLLDDADAVTARATLGITSLSTLDSDFRIKGSGDATKQLAFEVDGITTGTTRTVTVQDTDGTMALTVRDGFTTGDVKLTFKTTADPSWVLMDDKTIGDASSSATGRANADTANLYTLLWTNIVDQWAPVIGGRGASAAADFAAHKPLSLPKTLGRALAGYGTGTVTDSGVNADVDTTNDDLTVASNNTKWITGMSVVFTLTSGTITGLTSGNTYYISRSSATKVRLASTLANAQNSTSLIDFTAKSSPVWTITHTYTARVLGEAIGEQVHAQHINELLSHPHTYGRGAQGGGGGSGTSGDGAGGSVGNGTTNVAGGNVAMNLMQPTMFLTVMVKL